MCHIWIVESKLTFPLIRERDGWVPLAEERVHKVRSVARSRARHLFETNQYNHLTTGFISVRYRAKKYVKEVQK